MTSHPKVGRWCHWRGSLFLALLGLTLPVQAQRTDFGAADDPRESIQRVWWQRESTIGFMGGLSLIGAQWRGVGRLSADLVTRSFTGHIEGTLRAGVFGEYEPDVNEPYDALRAVEFIRYEPPQDSPFHLRTGQIRQMRLGTGHVVNFFSSTTAWNERTVGLETAWDAELFTIEGFTDNVLPDGVVGGHVGLRPMGWSSNHRLQTATLGVSYVRDLTDPLDGMEALEAYNVDVQFDAFGSGSITFEPFVSYAWYPSYGRGISFGADLGGKNFADLFDFYLRMALFYNGEAFIPGYIGTFYTVSSPHARILNAEENSQPGSEDRLAGVLLGDAAGGNDLLTEWRIASRRFEVWYAFRRHYGTQRLSTHNFAVYLRLLDRMTLDIAIDRAGLTGFLSIFNDMDDQSTLTFGLDYNLLPRLLPSLWLTVDARYSYERVAEGPDGGERYLVQRRFEPMTGFRFRF